MSKPPVEVVVINWKRPENVTKILRAFRQGSVPCTITLCDVHGAEEFAPQTEALALADRVYRWTRNFGGYNRYVPLGGYDHEYTYLFDDDLLPGSRCLEYHLDHAPARFGVLGQFGRRLDRDGEYRPTNVKRRSRLLEVDLVVRAYLVRTRNLGLLPITRCDFGEPGSFDTEDDIMLAVAMSRAGLRNYITPHSRDPETSASLENLPAPFALADRSDHFDRRTQAFALAQRLGWRSMRQRPGPALRITLEEMQDRTRARAND